MVSEPNPNIAGAPHGAHPHCTTAARIETVVTMQSLWALAQCYALYLDALKLHATTPKVDKHAKSMTKRLSSMEAALILLSIYVHSSYVTDSERSAVGLPQSTSQNAAMGPTRTAIASTLNEALRCQETPEAFRIQTSRVIEAALFFNLVETTDDERPNLKPLRGTERLHLLMRKAGLPAAMLLRDAIATRS